MTRDHCVKRSITYSELSESVFPSGWKKLLIGQDVPFNSWHSFINLREIGRLIWRHFLSPIFLWIEKRFVICRDTGGRLIEFEVNCFSCIFFRRKSVFQQAMEKISADCFDERIHYVIENGSVRFLLNEIIWMSAGSL